MWNNYVILMIRKYKSWSGLSLLNLLGMIGVYALIVLLISGFMATRNLLIMVVIVLIILVAAIAYINYITLQLKNRVKEFYVRKLLGASDGQIMSQLLLESLVLSVFLVVSGLVLAELVSPWCGQVFGIAISVTSMSFLVQLSVVIILVVPVGLVGVVLPVHTFINYLKNNFTKLSRPG